MKTIIISHPTQPEPLFQPLFQYIIAVSFVQLWRSGWARTAAFVLCRDDASRP